MVRALLPGWLRAPVEVRVSFDGRPYTLGERIHVGVELSPRRDVDVAEVRVDLVCEETWAETWVKTSRPGDEPWRPAWGALGCRSSRRTRPA